MDSKTKRSRIIFLAASLGLCLSLFSGQGLFIPGAGKALADDTIAVTARVLGPPAKPVVTTETACSNDQLSITLSWPADENSQTFDIERNGSTLVTGLSSSPYIDNNISENASYTYTITANGTMGPGSETSDPVTVDVGTCSSPPSQPTVAITTFGTKDVRNISETPRTDSRTPLFSGTTNIPNAIIDISVHSSQIIFATTHANSNGYWSWRAPEKLSTERHTIFVKSEDPDDPTRTASSSFSFIIKEEDNNNSGSTSEEKSSSESSSAPAQAPQQQASSTENQPPEAPVDFSLSLADDSVFQGKNLSAFIRINTLMPKYDGALAKILYKIVDQDGNEVFSFSENSVLSNGMLIPKDIAIPDYLKNDRYQLQTEISFGDYMIVNQRAFEIKLSPAVALNDIIPQKSSGFIIWLTSLGMVIFLYALLQFIKLRHRLKHGQARK